MSMTSNKRFTTEESRTKTSRLRRKLLLTCMFHWIGSGDSREGSTKFFLNSPRSFSSPMRIGEDRSSSLFSSTLLLSQAISSLCFPIRSQRMSMISSIWWRGASLAWKKMRRQGKTRRVPGLYQTKNLKKMG